MFILNELRNRENIDYSISGYIPTLETLLAVTKDNPIEDNFTYLKTTLQWLENATRTPSDEVQPEETETNPVIGPNTTNLLVFLNEGEEKENSVFTDSLEEIDEGHREDVVSKVYQDFTDILTTKPWSSEISRMGTSKFDILKLNGQKCYGKDKKDRPKNYKCGTNRICLYTISIAEENKEKLKEYYGLSNLDSVILVGMATNDHDEISKLAKSFVRNRENVLKLDEIFENQNANVEDLVKIIEDRNPYYEYLENENNRGERR